MLGDGRRDEEGVSDGMKQGKGGNAFFTPEKKWQ